MTPLEVPTDDRFGWWRLLRDVPSSWVVSQGETERFLYYDGPTLARSPHWARLSETRLVVGNQSIFRERNARNHDAFRHDSDAGTSSRAVFMGSETVSLSSPTVGG
jgi:hypothetical protein